MGLRDLIIPTALVKVADSGFTVRGLSPADALGLYYRHAGELSNLFEQFAGKVRAGLDVADGDVLQAGISMVNGAPQIMAEIIALGSESDPTGPDWDADVGVALRLPAAVQIDALQKIAELSFSSDMPPGKFFGLVLQMAKSTQAALTNLKA